MNDGRKKLELLGPARDNSCTKHTWVYFHSWGVRACIDCATEEKLWADFGLVKKDKDHEDQ